MLVARSLRRLCLLTSLMIAATAVLDAEGAGDWPHWRGPLDNGSTQEGSYPVKFDGGTNLLWKAPLPGKGCSTPIVYNQHIFLTAPDDGQDSVVAFDWSGKQLWQQTLGAERPGKNKNGSGSNPSPVTDGQHVFVYFKSGKLAALDLDGQVQWKTNLVEQYGRDTLYWDYGSSPVLTANDVVIALMHHGESWLAAFDKVTGKLNWKVARNYQTPDEGDHSYATPIVILHAGKEAILVWGGQHLTAHDASNGQILWSCGDFNPQSKSNWVAVASPVVAGDVAVVSYGRGTRLHGIRMGGKGDVTATDRIWERKDTGTFVTTPVEYQGRVYLVRDREEVECLDPATGKTLWASALPKNSSSYYASPVIADGKLYAARQDGIVFVTRITGVFEVLAENDMGERIIASPVPVQNRLLLRGEKHLFCVGRE
jgi:outer membrane protein assembly factor BamB